jgi:hypothetical protein
VAQPPTSWLNSTERVAQHTPYCWLSKTEISSNNLHEAPFKEIVEVEILPPRDQNGIAILNTYLINMPEVIKVELVTLIDKSVFKVMLNKPVNFVEQLSSLPQVFNAEETFEKGQKKIQITLSVKAKLEQKQNEVNDKINKIFKKKN